MLDIEGFARFPEEAVFLVFMLALLQSRFLCNVGDFY